MNNNELQESAQYAALDIEVLRLRYVPQGGEVVSEDEFVARGAELVRLAWDCITLLGEMLAWKIQAERAVTYESRRSIVTCYARAWQISESKLWKALVMVTRWPKLALPQDAPPTLAYEVISGCQTEQEAEGVLDLALGRGWTVGDVREIKALRALGLLDGWQRLRLVSDGDGLICVDDGERRVPVARLLEDDPLARAGAMLLRMRGRV